MSSRCRPSSPSSLSPAHVDGNDVVIAGNWHCHLHYCCTCCRPMVPDLDSMDGTKVFGMERQQLSLNGGRLIIKDTSLITNATYIFCLVFCL